MAVSAPPGGVGVCIGTSRVKSTMAGVDELQLQSRLPWTMPRLNSVSRAVDDFLQTDDSSINAGGELADIV